MLCRWNSKHLTNKIAKQGDANGGFRLGMVAYLDTCFFPRKNIAVMFESTDHDNGVVACCFIVQIERIDQSVNRSRGTCTSKKKNIVLRRIDWFLDDVPSLFTKSCWLLRTKTSFTVCIAIPKRSNRRSQVSPFTAMGVLQRKNVVSNVIFDEMQRSSWRRIVTIDH